MRLTISQTAHQMYLDCKNSLSRFRTAQVASKLHEEHGSQLVEYIVVLPMLFIAVMIGWQFFLAGHTFVITANAAREGARTLAVCGGGNVRNAVERTIPGYDPEIIQATRGGSRTVVVVGNDIPKAYIADFINPEFPQIRFRAVMRTEKCR